MAVAMASGSLRLNPNPRVGECCLPPSLRCCSVRFSTPFGAPIPSKIRLHSDATITTPRAASPAAVEARTSCLPQLSTLGFIFLCVDSNLLGQQDDSSSETDTIPTPKVIIDQDSDPDSTIVEITFGDRLGTLLDTMKALKNLGLNVVKANVCLDSSGKHNKFAITRAIAAVLHGLAIPLPYDPELLETIRLTIINNLIEYHPESSSQLAMGAAFGVEPPSQQVDVDVATHIDVYDDGPDRSLLVVQTADYPGLLVDLVKNITDIDIAVQSGEFDTEGLLAKAKFHVSYRNEPIKKPLQQVKNLLRFYLTIFSIFTHLIQYLLIEWHSCSLEQLALLLDKTDDRGGKLLGFCKDVAYTKFRVPIDCSVLSFLALLTVRFRQRILVEERDLDIEILVYKLERDRDDEREKRGII
ncbi:hypothetical protein ZIOFF_024320 [Zingiber officinale]|uniref:ACT domain-containing protein ACR n=1 Tax=Zingiber officinale TaxID=94328 RepID=A0A8J5GTE3_ZINOF|nr:hypothetical protein ZIOFF_024320 [Zingiber officinale]